MQKGQRKPNAKRRSVQQRKYNGTRKQLANRSSRNKARRKMEKSVGKKALRGKDVDHKDGNPRNNARKNLTISSVKRNRAKNKR